MTPLALSTGTVAALVVIVVIDLFAVVFGLSFVRARRAARAEVAAPGAPAVRGEAPPKAPKPVTRREFFRRSLLASLAVFSAEFGGATLAFLWPNLKGGFGSLINAGSVQDIVSEIASTSQPFYYGQGRFYIIPYDGQPSNGVDYEAEGLAAQGIMPLYQRCVHLGCRVPFCQQSQWFECPCHGSKYNLAGEYKLGPAPRGLDRFHVTITETGDVMVDTSVIVLGPPRGTDTTKEPPQGPFCVAPG
ncbi:MAG: ubiquinol-cytochrome c reductase iron-sulfur subunit [Actinomycetota bacterium]